MAVGKDSLFKNVKNVIDLTDMTTKAKFASYLGVSTPDSVDDAVAGKGLSLQIGDTSESFNQLTVSIGDIHADALGVGGLNVSTQEGAQAAINTIKAAINSESSIRDTDIAEEMMAYTKNNILVQSAQANQVPQGVLQLLG